MRRYEPYSISSSMMTSDDRAAIRIGGTGGRIIGRDLGLTCDAADEVARMLNEAYDAGRASVVVESTEPPFSCLDHG